MRSHKILLFVLPVVVLGMASVGFADFIGDTDGNTVTATAGNSLGTLYRG